MNPMTIAKLSEELDDFSRFEGEGGLELPESGEASVDRPLECQPAQIGQDGTSDKNDLTRTKPPSQAKSLGAK